MGPPSRRRCAEAKDADRGPQILLHAAPAAAEFQEPERGDEGIPAETIVRAAHLDLVSHLPQPLRHVFRLPEVQGKKLDGSMTPSCIESRRRKRLRLSYPPPRGAGRAGA